VALVGEPAEIDVYADGLTTEEAAGLAGGTSAVIRVWVHRGHLVLASRDEHGRPRYKALDVAKAEAKTRRHTRR
jgi:hypothetical protein